MDELVFQVDETDDGGYTARADGHAIFTEANSRDELETNVHDAVRCHFGRGGGPRRVRLHFIRNERRKP